MICLSEKAVDARLCLVRIGSVEPVVMSVLCTFEDKNKDKIYLVFRDKEGNHGLQLREYKENNGKYKLYRVEDTDVIYEIQALLCVLKYQNSNRGGVKNETH